MLESETFSESNAAVIDRYSDITPCIDCRTSQQNLNLDVAARQSYNNGFQLAAEFVMAECDLASLEEYIIPASNKWQARAIALDILRKY